jgi:hypothetical protein
LFAGARTLPETVREEKMSCSTLFRRMLHITAMSMIGTFWCGVLAVPLPAKAEQSAPLARQVQQRVAAIDAKFKVTKPFLERGIDLGEGIDVLAWGAVKAIEKISVKVQGERGELLQDFYWQQGMLIAARQRSIDYGAYMTELPAHKPWPRKVIKDDRFEFAGDVVLHERSFGVSPTAKVNVHMVLADLKAGALSYKRLMEIPETKENKRGNCSWSCVSKPSEQTDTCLAYECK